MYKTDEKKSNKNIKFYTLYQKKTVFIEDHVKKQNNFNK